MGENASPSDEIITKHHIKFIKRIGIDMLEVGLKRMNLLTKGPLDGSDAKFWK